MLDGLPLVVGSHPGYRKSKDYLFRLGAELSHLFCMLMLSLSQIAKICSYQAGLWLEHVTSLFRHSEINDRMKDGSPSLAGQAEDRLLFYVHVQP